MAISRRDFLKAGAGAAIVVATGAAAAGQDTQPARRPNLLFVCADEWRRQALGAMGEDPVITPAMDGFARSGLVLTRCVSAYPVCSPYRAMLLTGRFPLSTGITSNCCTGEPRLFLKPEEICIAEVLKDAGYDTGYIGKWHLDDPAEFELKVRPKDDRDKFWDAYTPPGPKRQGFDFWYSYGCSNRHLTPHYWRDDPTPIEINQWSPEHETDIAIDYMRTRGRQRPFALFLNWNPPHMPFHQLPPRYRELYQGKAPREVLNRPNVRLEGDTDKLLRDACDYFGAIKGLDDNFARLTRFLDEAGLAQDTIVVLTADHGEMMGSQGRMNKDIWYEESIGVPFVIRWPGQARNGRDDLLLNTFDIMPSLLGLMDLPIPSTVEGSDYSAILRGRGGARPQSTFLCSYPGRTVAASQRGGWRGIRTPRYTYAVNREGRKVERLLYDNDTDPYQLNPARAANAPEGEVMKRLEEDLKAWLTRAHDRFPLG